MLLFSAKFVFLPLMGVKGLLQALQKCTNVSPLGQFKGKRIAIDASGWLHKGIFTAAEDFVDSNFEDYQLYVDWIINRLRNMRDFGIEPVLVFDGKRSVLKAETQGKREDLRQSNMESARRLISSMRATGDPACREKLRSEAVAAVQRGLGVSHDMEVNTIAALRKLGFTVIIAPYEADAQLAYLCHIGFTDAVMTEDSDILVYAAVSGKPFDILYKYEKSGVVQVVNLANIGILSSESNGDSSMDTYSGSQGMPQSQTYSQQISSQASANSEKGKTSGKEKDKDKDKERGFVMNLKSFRGTAGRRMFVQMCIMAGCDYIENIPSVGIATAQQVYTEQYIH